MASHWWDASAIYGSDADTTGKLRSHQGGKLQTEKRLLPVDATTQIVSTGFSTNWWVGLEMLHTLFAMEHNAICDRLQLEFSNWNDEQLFQTTRLINAALMAKIHTVEWTPAILGHPTLQFGMRANWWGIAGERLTKLIGRIGRGEVFSGIPGSPHDHQDVPFSLTEEFVSVYRMHSLLPDEIAFRRLATGEVVKTLKMEEVLRERSHAVIGGDLTIIDALYSFGIAHPGALTLHNFPNFLRRLDVPADASGGPAEIVDLGAIDVLRDRERAVPRYNRFRQLLRLKPAGSFEELTDNAEWARELRAVYGRRESGGSPRRIAGGNPTKGLRLQRDRLRILVLMASRRIEERSLFHRGLQFGLYSQSGSIGSAKTTCRACCCGTIRSWSRPSGEARTPSPLGARWIRLANPQWPGVSPIAHDRAAPHRYMRGQHPWSTSVACHGGHHPEALPISLAQPRGGLSMAIKDTNTNGIMKGTLRFPQSRRPLPSGSEPAAGRTADHPPTKARRQERGQREEEWNGHRCDVRPRPLRNQAE